MEKAPTTNTFPENLERLPPTAVGPKIFQLTSVRSADGDVYNYSLTTNTERLKWRTTRSELGPTR